ncbi:MAG: hypothetical protein ISS65_08690 [Desulfobacterales bacterium]|uniref:Uncharacterized protein n=1 Tax=Candidatus Desulfatibia profunda TaxID=2841695 RepID=A0A8J6NJC3_9BACT|nr:hypothetical protein [Candidatus Desulfatibia profunda]MBL7180267.1 hypothetical protein [Desulfobacterales bacterium]
MPNEEQKTIEDYLNDMIIPIVKIQGIAALFESDRIESRKTFNSEQSNGICNVLEGIAKELKDLADKAIEAIDEEVSHET